jgi:hypothetical protein
MESINDNYGYGFQFLPPLFSLSYYLRTFLRHKCSELKNIINRNCSLETVWFNGAVVGLKPVAYLQLGPCSVRKVNMLLNGNC